MKRIIPTLLLFALPLAFAEEGSTRLSAEVLWQLQRVGSPVVSPDGGQVVVPVTTYPEDGGDANSRLWLLSTAEEIDQRPLSAEEVSASAEEMSAQVEEAHARARRGSEPDGRPDWRVGTQVGG